ncbi:MAG: type II secretion system F family protein [Pseudomonadota bacterium]|nr:MAG: hypothetical protein DIU72_04130 [Pseudomonadota bacterium]
MMLSVLLATLSAFLLGLLLAQILRQAAARLRERYDLRDTAEVGELLLEIEGRTALVAGIVVGAILGVFGLALGGLAFALAVWTGGAALVPMLLRRRRERWRAALEAQLADGLSTVGAALRAGHSLQRAFEQLAEEAPQPLRRELAVVVRQCRLGRSLDEALDLFAQRARSEDLDLLVVSVAVARRSGGQLSRVLDRIAGAARERMRLKGKIRALTAQGRMQAWVIAALPLLLFFAMAWQRPDLVDPVLQTPVGLGLCAAVGLMEALGLWAIRRIVSIRV